MVCEALPEKVLPHISYVIVPDSSVALGEIASEWYDHPSRKLKLVGVTGTNGKTTTATLVYEMARLLGHKAGLLSTVCNYIETTPVPTAQTTPRRCEHQRTAGAHGGRRGAHTLPWRSAHAAHQHRIWAALCRRHLHQPHARSSGLSQDGPGLSRSQEIVFDGLPASAFALTNADDKVGLVMLQNCAAARRTYSLALYGRFQGQDTLKAALTGRC